MFTPTRQRTASMRFTKLQKNADVRLHASIVFHDTKHNHTQRGLQCSQNVLPACQQATPPSRTRCTYTSIL